MSKRSTGDALIVIALLAFIAGWVYFTVFVPDWPDAKELTDTQAVLALILIIGPPMWAAGLIRSVIEDG